jgi:acetoin utilization deacetylase AcuC-like enzyme
MKEKKSKVYCTFQDAPEHSYPGHPESPKRLVPLKGWLQKPPYPEIEWLDFTPADEADVLLIHRKTLLEDLKSECQEGPHEFEPSPSYVTEDSYQAALGAVGATLAVSRRILDEGSGFGFAIVRPPGHHAEPDESMGFCLFNNVAIAAADAVASGLKKVAIVDFDAHHGNGTQSAFWETPQVGYFSTHEKDIYPGTGLLGSASHARGRIINVPLPAFSGNTAFMRVFDKILKPWVQSFRPEMLFISAGYDSHFSDPITTLTLNTKGFFQLTQQLVQLADEICNGRMMFVLEGGYDPIALKDNIQSTIAALSGNTTFPDHYGKGPGPSPDIDTLIDDLKKIHHI